MKDKKFAFRVSENNLEAIRSKALKAKMTVTDYLVACALGKKIVVIDGLPAFIAELKANGRNLNQLVILANMGRISSVRLDETRELYAEIYEQLCQLVGRKR